MKKGKKNNKGLKISNIDLITFANDVGKISKFLNEDSNVNVNNELHILITDYVDIRNEIHSRVADANRYLEFSLFILGGFIATIAIIEKSNKFMLIGFPFSLCCMALLIIRSDYMVLNLAKYTINILKNDINSLIGNRIEVLQWEEYRYNNDFNKGLFQKIFTLFLGGVRIAIPFILSIMLVIFYTLLSIDEKGIINNSIDMYIIIIMIIGVSITFLIIIAWLKYSKKEYEKILRRSIDE